MKTKKSAAGAALKAKENKSTSSTTANAAGKPAEYKPDAAPKAPAFASATSQPQKPAENKPVSITTPPPAASIAQPLRPALAAPAPAYKAPQAPVTPAQTVKPPEARPAQPAVATIEVKADVGFGNAVYLRGQGPGLTWDHGVQLSCVDRGTWRWSKPIPAPITFKVLLNDKVWSTGKDLVVAPGQKLEFSPSFP